MRRAEAIRPLERPLILGMGYKEGSDDTRFSPGGRLLRLLRARGMDPLVHDPVAQRDGGPALEDMLGRAREVFVAVPDPSYRSLTWADLARLAPGAVVVDPWLMWGQPRPLMLLEAA